MKKTILVTGVVVALSIALNSTNFVHSDPNGAPAGNTGAPKTTGTETTCARSGCHGSLLNAGPHAVALAITGAPTSFDPGSTYTITASVVNGTGSAAGFQVVCLGPAKTSVGTWTAGTGSKLVSGSGRSYLTHSARTRKSWTFNWKAPATSPDSVTFFVACQETVSGTYHTYTNKLVFYKTVVTANEEMVATGDFILYPVPATDRINVEMSGLASATRLDVMGMDGRQILSRQVLPGVAFEEVELPPTMKPGQYLVRIMNEKGIASRRFTKL